MLTVESIKAYRKQFNTNNCAFSEPSDLVFVIDDASDKTYISPFDETDKQFADRLERCKQTGRNLFFEEWNEFKYQENCLY